MPETRKGLIIVYTGPGKGKTTAALGTMLRCVGQGMKALMVQFIKGSWHYGELEAAHLLGEERFKILPMGRGFVKVGAEKPDPEDIRLANEAWEFARQIILPPQDVLAGEFPRFVRQTDVLRIRFFCTYLHKAAAHGQDLETLLTQQAGGLELPVVPGALYELYHQYLQSLPYAAQRSPQGRGGLPPTRSGVDDN